jgi:hypothetical protein
MVCPDCCQTYFDARSVIAISWRTVLSADATPSPGCDGRHTTISASLLRWLATEKGLRGACRGHDSLDCSGLNLRRSRCEAILVTLCVFDNVAELPVAVLRTRTWLKYQGCHWLAKLRIGKTKFRCKQHFSTDSNNVPTTPPLVPSHPVGISQARPAWELCPRLHGQ